MEIKEAQKKVAAFATERGWEANLPTQRVAHLMREVGRMGEHTMFAEGMTAKQPAHDMEKQIGDIMFSLLQLANRLDISVEAGLNKAMAADSTKYPAEETRKKSMASLKRAATKFNLNPY
ncbi:MAG: MazG-like family protein [Proteobacteria bacterium]|nr:MazG-like family protein [Pseudomonadota bacterium]MBU1595294.1 MazG-like family protein [Pseudomonadota bacterium]